MTKSTLFALGLAALTACDAEPAAPADEEPFEVVDPVEAEREAGELLDAWHAAAAAADEDAYFAAFAADGVFLGTDMTERWDRAAFREYAHPHFERGRAWTFTSTRREIEVRGDVLWFDEDLDTELGPARGSGVLVRDGERWRIAQYNLALTIPNERFAEVRDLLEQPMPADPADVESPADPADAPGE